MIEILLEILVIVLLVVLNGVFAMSEMALVSSRKGRLQEMRDGGHRGARAALRLLDDPTRFLATVQIGITLIGILAGAFSGATLAEKLGAFLDTVPGIAPHGDPVAIAVVVIAITYLSLVVGELVPKRVALSHAEPIATLVARPMAAVSRVAAPAVWVIRLSVDALLGLAGLRDRRQAVVSEDEVKALIAEGTRAGVFVPRERELIEGVLRIADRPVRLLMTDRADVVWLDADANSRTVRATIAGTRHSRYPLCRGDIHHPIGIVRAKDLLDRILAGGAPDLAAIAGPVEIVPEWMPGLALLDRFRATGRHIAVVRDEAGLTLGIVTSTDILAAIAGDLPGVGEQATDALVRRDDGSWLVDGLMPIDEFEDRSGLRGLRGQGDYHTVAGLVLHLLGDLPRVGQAVAHAGTRFEVIDMDGPRIDKVIVWPAPDPHEFEEHPGAFDS